MERTGTCFYLAIREDEPCGHGENSKRVLFPDGMQVLRCLKHQGVGGEQRRIPGGTEREIAQNGFRLQRERLTAVPVLLAPPVSRRGRRQARLEAVACTLAFARAFPRGFRIGTPCGRIAQRLDDMAGQSFLDVSMPRHGLGHPSDGIAVPVVLTAMAHQDTIEPLKRSDQIDPPHDTTKSSTLRMPGNSSLVKS